MIDSKLIEMLRCPIDGGHLRLAEESMVGRVNQAIGRGEVRGHQGHKVPEPIDGGLVNEQGNRLYPIRGDIPMLVADEAIELEA